MIITKEKDLAGMREISKIVALIMQEMVEKTVPGITTGELDELAARLLNKYGAASAPISCYNFPGYTCISVNEEIAHGIPGKRVLKPGDLVNIDVSAERHGYYADHGKTVLLEPGDKVGKRLIEASQKALENSIAEAVAGNRLNKIGKATEDTARRFGLGTIRNLCGHGVGRSLHEDPETINNYYEPHDRRVIQNGMVLAIETFIAERDDHVKEDKENHWTLRTPRHTRSAQFEHTVLVTEEEPLILTLL